MTDRHSRVCALAFAAALALIALLPPAASAAPYVSFTVNDLGGGLFLYDLDLDNDSGSEPLSGLNVLNAGTIFDLDDTSTISAPPGWSYFEPLLPFVDELNFFSLDGADDIAIDAVLGGFSFVSTTDPSTIGNTFGVEAIGGTSSSQIPMDDAYLVPEPASGLLFGAALVALAAARQRRSAAARG